MFEGSQVFQLVSSEICCLRLPRLLLFLIQYVGYGYLQLSPSSLRRWIYLLTAAVYKEGGVVCNVGHKQPLALQNTTLFRIAVPQSDRGSIAQ